MNGTRRKLISIVIPAWNESEVLDELFKRLGQLMERQSRYNFEVILIDNGSWDDTWDKMLRFRAADERFRLIQLTRNFMADGAILAGFQAATGDAAIMMDADLQDPPELIDRFLECWEQGAEVVYGEIRRRDTVNFLKRAMIGIYFVVLTRLTGGAITRNASGFRLLDRRSYLALNNLPEHNRFTRGLSTWSGFRSETIEFERPGRFAGDSKAPFIDILKEAWDGIYAFSSLPARIPTYIGVLEILAGFATFLAQFLLVFLGGAEWSPPWLLAALGLVLFGLLSCSLGLMGGFIWRIMDEVRGRPGYVTRRAEGFDGDTESRERP